MNVLAINGSARKDGNTALLIREVFKQLEAEGIGTEMIQLAGTPIRGCMACGACYQRKDHKCVITSDPVNEIIAKMEKADAIILGSPTYFADVSSELKALIDRAGYVGRANDGLWRRKLGAGVIAVRRCGAIHAFDTINHFFLISEMLIVGSSYWNMGMGREAGGVAGDDEGIDTMKTLGLNMAWALNKLHG
ncbi:MAG TPA: flavodoxin family protein [Candidatus Ozemobacteraceae bacterium]|nr:flavodoxin family protein [Candidatus Ozemobacteraceae bacterium]